MKPHSLFSIVLKVLGIVLIKDFVVILPQLFYFLPIMVMDKGIDDSYTIWQTVVIILTLMIDYIIIYMLIFETNYVIKKLKILSSFTEDTLNLNIHRSVVIHATALIIGALIIIDRMPYLAGSIIDYLTADKDFGLTMPGKFLKDILIDIGVLLIGVWIFMNPRFIAAYIEKSMRKAKFPKEKSSEN